MNLNNISSLFAMLIFTLVNAQDCQNIFISEYVCGTGNNKAIELYNPTAESIDLDGYILERWSNGSFSVTDQLNLEGVIPAFGTWVVVNGQSEDIDLGNFISPACDPELQALADQLDNPFPAPTFFNGNDALLLVNYSVSPPQVVDVFGKPGEDPGVAWIAPDGTFITNSQTMVRKFEITHGVSTIPIQFLPLAEWDTLGTDTWTNLGIHNSECHNGCNLSFDLGQDTLSFCNQESVVLDAGEGYASYQWSTGETTATIEVQLSGTYSIQVSDGDGCFDSDSAYVDLLQVEILQADTIVAPGQTVVLDAEASNPSPPAPQQETCNGLFFSEIFVGSGNNKAIEIYNPTNDSINLEGYVIERLANGSPNTTDALNLEGIVPPFSTWLVAHGQTEDIVLGTFISPACDPEIQALADQLDNPYPAPTFMNGNDALLLINTNVSPVEVLDIFGKPGEDPGAGWSGPDGTIITSSQTLVRKYEISEGVALPPEVFQPLDEWEAIGFENRSSLGVHENTCSTFNGDGDQLSYLWSTGDTTASIEVNPTQNTTYTVAVSNGITTCTDNVFVSVTCEVDGGVLAVTNPLADFCVGDNDPNVISVQVSDNSGSGSYGVVNSNTFDIVAGNNSGTFNFENFPPATYFIGYVSYLEPDFLVGKDNLSDFDGCFDISNLVSVSTYELEAGMISANQATTFCVGPDAPMNIGFSVTGQIGPNFRWALLDQGFAEVLLSNQSGSFNVSNLNPGTYRVVHVAFGNEVSLGQVDPQNITGCIDVSNSLTLLLLDCGLVNFAIKSNPVDQNASVAFAMSEGGMALLEIYDLSGRLVRSVYNGYAEEGMEYQFSTDVSDLSNGVYLYRLTSDKNVIIEKFIISR